AGGEFVRPMGMMEVTTHVCGTAIVGAAAGAAAETTAQHETAHRNLLSPGLEEPPADPSRGRHASRASSEYARSRIGARRHAAGHRVALRRPPRRAAMKVEKNPIPGRIRGSIPDGCWPHTRGGPPSSA